MNFRKRLLKQAQDSWNFIWSNGTQLQSDLLTPVLRLADTQLSDPVDILYDLEGNIKLISALNKTYASTLSINNSAVKEIELIVAWNCLTTSQAIASLADLYNERADDNITVVIGKVGTTDVNGTVRFHVQSNPSGSYYPIIPNLFYTIHMIFNYNPNHHIVIINNGERIIESTGTRQGWERKQSIISISEMSKNIEDKIIIKQIKIKFE